jgi:hypothetical protein
LLAAEARAIAAAWVRDQVATTGAIDGAFLAGSINFLAPDEPLPEYSDVDLWLVTAGAGATALPRGKLAYRGLLLDVSHTAADALPSVETALADYHLAPSFNAGAILLDASGALAALHAGVAADFAQRRWIERRCDHARRHGLGYVRLFASAQTLPDRVIAWQFAAGICAHVLLVAALRNPTVRRRFAAVRDVLAEYGELPLHEELLAAAQAERCLTAMSAAFDAAARVPDRPFPFASDVTPVARPIAVDGSAGLLRAGLHREAMYWIAVTHSRCLRILEHAGDAAGSALPYRELLALLGAGSQDDLQRHIGAVVTLVPRVADAARRIIDRNPDVV